ncbi:hypothetical protein DXB59_00965 [Ruminococcus sp. OM05-10BH]|nr:hypothetical protein DXB59_00965 [Ruminococcus sp. OM05-10BH]
MKRRTENKMGKRILAGICCIGLLTAAGCSQNQEEPDPQELYQAAVEKNGELTDLDMTMGTKMTLEQAGETVDIDMNVDMLMSGYNTSDLQYQMETTTSLLGQNIEMTAFYTDGYYYMETSGQKLKYPYDLEAITEQVENSMGGTVSSEAMTELTAEKEGGKYETYLYRRSGEDDQLYKGDSFQYADRNRNGGFYNREGRRILSDQSGRLLYRK